MTNILPALKNLLSHSSEIRTADVERIAIGQFGNIGSIYNSYQDEILGNVHNNMKAKTVISNDLVMCKLYHGRTYQTQNLLEMVGIDRQLRLSIILQIVQPKGIASIINYPRSIDTYTRFLYFRYQSSIESCHTDLIKRQKLDTSFKSDPRATHVITKIIRGIHAVVIIQLPHDEQAEIDILLERIRASLEHKENNILMTLKDRDLLSRIISTTVYSNICTLSEITNVYDIWQKILQIRDKTNEHSDLVYILSSIQQINLENTDNNVNNTTLTEHDIENFENSLLQKLSKLRVLNVRINHELPELLQDKLEEPLTVARQSFLEIKNLYNNVMQQIGNLFVRLRKNEVEINSVTEILNSDVQDTIDASTRRLTDISDDLKFKGNLIKQLENTGFEYYDAAKLGLTENSNEQFVQDLLLKNNYNKLFFCATDHLKQQSSKQWDTLYSQMIKQRQENSELAIIYADFTYTKWNLKEMIILPSKQQTINIPQSNDEYINILLLGESGVGKSTFINAFANYLRYDTLNQAESSKPYVIIPVSFVMTINDEYDEEIVNFGDVDSNEDHNNSGQSVTQQCRSYVFKLSNEKKLRIIDTPGFGDTRIDNQDNVNMKIIFSFINHIPYLNSICFLFKPNVKQLNRFLYSCYKQLFEFFGENIRDHFIFCFTNARSTFFAPGDTRPLLQSFFNSFPIKNIPFGKKNTFCFDSEAFRYLVALQRSLVFKEIERDEFEKSWIRSVAEAQRFRNYLCNDLRSYRKNIEWQSVQEIQFQINSIIRPILEAIRNILRNILLFDVNSYIKLKPVKVNEDSVICYSYERQRQQFGQCWILLDHLHSLSNQCSLDQHSSVAYRLGYEYVNDRINESLVDLNQQRTTLCKVSAELACFLTASQLNQEDPFLSGLIRMITEENMICQKENQNHINQKLMIELEKFKNEYQNFNAKYSKKKNKPLSDIYELIKSVNEISMVKKQLHAIRKHHKSLLTATEQNFYEESTDF
ncbi:unnamed protein product [Adineta steineri]|uniref:AIG1-type G domain-containing protein n=1 Tax=Adineta steineri TaxID=433720 RepID=A0A815B7D9_9BILA|nr:unnamed protein product [Adineta steineri]CAF1554851.1 unnamed protein product [Adineta steineri]